jgi:hypothetical protein
VKPPVAPTTWTLSAIPEGISICCMVTTLILSVPLHRSLYSACSSSLFLFCFCVLALDSPTSAIPADYQMFRLTIREATSSQIRAQCFLI